MIDLRSLDAWPTAGAHVLLSGIEISACLCKSFFDVLGVFPEVSQALPKHVHRGLTCRSQISGRGHMFLGGKGTRVHAPVVCNRIFIFGSEGCGTEYPQKLTLGLQTTQAMT